MGGEFSPFCVTSPHPLALFHTARPSTPPPKQRKEVRHDQAPKTVRLYESLELRAEYDGQARLRRRRRIAQERRALRRVSKRDDNPYGPAKPLSDSAADH